MNYYLSLLSMVIASFAAGQPGSIEAIACEYFLNKIVPVEYPNGLKVSFRERTEKEFSTFGLIDNCFEESDINFKVRLDSVAFNSSKHSAEGFRIKLSRKPNYVKNWARTKLWIYKATKLDELFYVELTLHTKHQGQDSYILEITKGGEVMRYCRGSLIF